MMTQIANKIFNIMRSPKAHIAAFGILLFVVAIIAFSAAFMAIGFLFIDSVFFIGKISWWLAVAYVAGIIYTSAYAVIYRSGKP